MAFAHFGVGDFVVLESAYDGYVEDGYMNARAGERVKVLYEAAATDEEGWIYGESQHHGWLPTECIKKPERRTLRNNCRMKSSPECRDCIPLRLISGKKVYVHEERDGWVRITYRGSKGWVHRTAFVDASPPLTAAGRPPLDASSCRAIVSRISPVPVLPRVKEVTFGVEQLDRVFREQCDQHPAGEVPDQDILAALWRSGEHADFFVDARGFPDPGYMTHTGHRGVRPGIVAGIVNNTNFRGWLYKTKQKFTKCVQRLQTASSGAASPLITVAVFCKSGKDRSVAFGRVLQQIFERAGFRFEGLAHLFRHSRSRRGRGQRNECTMRSPQYAELVDKVWATWLNQH